MPKTTEEVRLAHNGKKIATTHGFSAVEAERLDQALRASAKTIAPTPIGKNRNELYASHKNQIMTQFQNQWDWSKASQKWTESSIGKVFSNYLFDYNKKSTPKTVSKAKATKKNDTLNSISHPKHIVPYLGEEDAPTKPTRGRPQKLKSPFSFTPINRRSPKLSESPFDKPSRSPIDSVLPSTEYGLDETEGKDAAQILPKLTDVILVVYPSSSDPWGRESFSFSLWRCQVPVNGRDARPESLQDWRDLSFLDLLRQLKSEQVLTPEEMVVWSEYDHVITSDMTFASAVQEQLYGASSNNLAPNEATFAIIRSRLLALLCAKSSLLTFDQDPRCPWRRRIWQWDAYRSPAWLKDIFLLFSAGHSFEVVIKVRNSQTAKSRI
ncbi:hypothetical protein KCU98_g176, partial [Aureobasidium melanogenum]